MTAAQAEGERDAGPPAKAKALSLRARAKINLCLSVSPPLPAGATDEAGRPRGGWHRICSWFAPIELADEVTIERLAEGGRGAASRFEVVWAPTKKGGANAPIEWPLEKDLGVRAHALLQQHLGRDLPVHVRVVKHIPAGGGLGGGSADAAAVLLGLRELFAPTLAVSTLVELSKSLGSDIAFFLDDAHGGGVDASHGLGSTLPRRQAPPATPPPRPAIVSNFGDRIERIASPVKGLGLVLIVPGYGCPTPAVYGAYDRSPRELREAAVRALAARSDSLVGEDLFNDLEAPACAVAPELGALLTRLRACHDLPRVHVTGSGSTLFCLSGEPEALARRIGALEPSVSVVPTRVA